MLYEKVTYEGLRRESGICRYCHCERLGSRPGPNSIAFADRHPSWTSAGVLLMAKDTKVFARKNSDWAWWEIADFFQGGVERHYPDCHQLEGEQD